jgi:hypothetical protein
LTRRHVREDIAKVGNFEDALRDYKEEEELKVAPK